MGNRQGELEAIEQQENWHNGMTQTIGVMQWMAISSSERIGKEGEAVDYPCMLGSVLAV